MRAVVLISGRGSNLQALLAAQRGGELGVKIVGVISSRDDAPGLRRAAAAGCRVAVVDATRYPGRAAFDAALSEQIDAWQADLVLLAGFLRIFTDDFVIRYQNRMLNIHPSLLPALRGLHTHRRAIAEGHTEHGCSVHAVTPELDGGPVILQARVAVRAEDDEQTLAERVLRQEHRIYPHVVRWFADGRLQLNPDSVILDGKPLARPLQVRAGDPLPD
ncbi:phosphoribosylglycinamide formyltransferase [Methylonatrum kenyense]|uniref:phosphoribosylglycinamide formyltransferase n=1 Tax=Methylonatrum kenyense TaxID=455253 RepID=UPI0020BFDFD4|nr:phosphoribosylglycinamide formyltransferase [Methylonatrum kenyense]MCK8516079.1 phosphoribosylglycinamide formyltransferase [Methylonatrum kenyense]